MGYSGPGYGILSLAVSEKYIWCLDYKGGLFCSALPGAGLRWQKFEDAVQQVAVSPSGRPPRLPAGTPAARLAHSGPCSGPIPSADRPVPPVPAGLGGFLPQNRDHSI